LFGQCPDKDSLWKKLNSFKDTSASLHIKFLNELLNDELVISNCPYRIDSTHAILLQKISRLYFRQGNYFKAVQFCRQSIDLIATNFSNPSVNPKYLIQNYYFLSVFYDSLNKISERMKSLDSCASIAVRLKSVDLFCLKALYSRLEYCFNIGDFARCISYADRCELLASEYAKSGIDKAYADGLTYVEGCSAYKANALLNLKDYKAAEKILANKVDEYQKQGSIKYLGTLYEHLAEIQVKEGNYHKAVLLFNRALDFDRKSGNVLGRKIILGQIGYLIYDQHLHDRDNALTFYRRALLCVNTDQYQNAEDAMVTLNILCNMANIWVGQARYDSAFKYFQLAFDQIKPGADETKMLKNSLDEFFKTNKISYFTSLLIDKGDAFFQKYITTNNLSALHEAIRIYKMSDKILDRIKAEQFEISSKLFWRSDSRRLYEHAIEASFVENNPSDAFYFFEKSRAVLLNDQLNQLSNTSNEDILKLAQIKRRILQFERERSTRDDSGKQYADIQSELFTCKEEMDQLEQHIRQNSPFYFQSFVDTANISLQDVQTGILMDHQGLLEIFSGDSSGYSLFITKKNVYFNRINKADFDSTARSFLSYLSNLALLNGQFYNFLSTSYHLYKLVFQNNPVPNGRIIISPDGQNFPFEALVTSPSAVSPAYFLYEHAVSYTYSARYLLTHFATNTFNSRGNFLGVAPVQYASGSALASLQGSDLSLIQIGSYFNRVHNLVTTDASRNNFQKQYSGYKIIQLYTHASDSSNQEEPVIYFADSALYLSDLIQENKPETRLIVLSACETGNGKLYKGEGVFSFSRGFASLGIPSSITNLWAVDNKSTYRITELFYKWFSRGIPIDIALQKAKKEFIQQASKENKLPYYWAATMLAGKSDAIEFDKNYLWKDVVIILSLLGLSIFVWQKGVRNKN
jgi:CHAT domain-containing protein/tetratricopeptide (TPR) repeat protein